MTNSNKLLFTALAFTAMLTAQTIPPAQGPPPPSGPNMKETPTLIFASVIHTEAERAFTRINTALAARNDVHAKVSQFSLQQYSFQHPQTQYPDRPNDLYVSVAHRLVVKVSNIEYHSAIGWIPYPFDRKIYINIYVNTFCEGWQAGSGKIKFVSRSDQPYLDSNPSGAEAAVNFFLGSWLIDYVNGKILENLPQSLGSSTSAPSDEDARCNSLGLKSGDPSYYVQWAVLPWPPRPFMSVRLTKVKRLTAHKYDGTVLYSTIESPGVDVWADIENAYYQLPPMIEGQEVAVSSSPMHIMEPPIGSSLVIVGSTDIGTRDSGWASFPSSANYGSGTQKVIVKKSFWMPPQPPLIPKPVQVFIPAYELTFQIVIPGQHPIEF